MVRARMNSAGRDGQWEWDERRHGVTNRRAEPLPGTGVLNHLLEKYWGYSSFRPLQREAMDAVMAGRDSLLVLPTGGGKSLCFQAPALARDGLAIVVSPLISLMKDQVDTLVGNGVAAACYNSSMPAEHKAEVARGVREGKYRLLYVAPERLVGEGGDGFQNLLSSQPVSFIAVDEAHCISQWGHDFRPEYRQLARLRDRWPSISLHAYTATATARVRKDIVAQLGLRDATELVGSFDRPNLVYRVLARSSLKTQILDVLERHRGQAGIIYCTSRKEVEALAQWLQDTGWRARPYHAGLAGRGTPSQPGRVPQRRHRSDRRHRGVRHGHRSIRCAIRDSRRRAAIARALSAGIRPCRSRRSRSRMRADCLRRGLPEVAHDAREKRRAVGGAARPVARHGALCRQRRLPSQAAGRVFRRDVREGRLRRLRLLPGRARTGDRAGHRGAQDSFVRGARRPALWRRARDQRLAWQRQRPGALARAS